VARHAGAARVTVTLDAEGDDLVLRVSDDGKGVAAADLEAPSASDSRDAGAGPRGRGSVSVEGAPGRGTQVLAAFRGARGAPS